MLAEMNDVDHIHFVQVRFDKERSLLSTVLQSTRDEELFYFETPLEDDTFNELYNLVKNPISEEELEKKILKLYNVSGNLINAERETGHFGSSFEGSVPGRSLRRPLNGDI